jgi:alkanesulfonate monooxygenase SsuD/methylene tetrahydromethanopterin reductase-like flavin-dependent oxidoreductase (luciferase family)
MEFGMFHEFLRAKGQSETDAFAKAFEIVDAAELHGLDAMWIAELHVSPDRSVASAPLTLAAAIASRTKRMKVGIGVQVLPLMHPLQLAEEVTTVDHISGGRLIFGVGRSGFPKTYEAYGIPYSESRERFAETLEILKKAFTEERFSHSGRWYSFNNVCLVPKPLQTTWPSLRVAATSADTFPATGAGGYPIFCAVRFGTLSELGPNLRAYHAAWREAGHPGRGKVYLRVPIYVAATEAAALSEPQSSIMQYYKALGARIEESATLDGARPEEQRAERGARLQAITWDEVLRDKIVVGTPGQVAARLAALQAELGLDGILAELNCGAQIPHDRVLESLRLLCREVIPAVKLARAA